MPNLFEHFRVPSKFGETKVTESREQNKLVCFFRTVSHSEAYQGALNSFNLARIWLVSSPNGVKGWFPRRKPMGSSKETTGFPQGTHRFPRGFTLVPGIEQNEKDKAVKLKHIGRDQIQVNHFG